ncbi:TPA: hypothetical protein DEP34_02645 [Candidatus Uhrbacteria bacterium]|uniref:CxxC-x17-CxxC domain-containing protein n=2 Tax=Candidatus Uhriibacteriota TaxID=1752732 RepID=A0A0G1Q603_9BACT|nr:MAG: hypothetical protein UX45_C0018G0021 [Candidatus Uhrbacteria bacterium GW2011_GWF2_46_218]KKU40429.1 MAG: hypothetical protein UX57_C0017G0021 [Candidatus Uhrbacteria bacterium GW2011_GWE2_46_68]HBK33877.1 hypothetical protein [Candidatus Uhrbacteria bacterium]HCB19260.1 hypothetical protein [Candidatus Uhrbacteria bacterium]
MRNFYNQGGSGGWKSRKSFGGSRGGGSWGGRGSDGDRPMIYEATCSACGQDCEIPFRPTGSRPVFCNSCFKKEENGGGRPPQRFGGSGRGGRPSFGDKPMFPAQCDACGNECQVPFRPTGEKPVYCSDCFSKQAPSDSGRKSRSEKTFGGNDHQDGMRKELATIQSKLDAILAVLNPSAIVKTEKKEKKVEEVKTEAASVKKEEIISKKEVAPKKEADLKKETVKKEPKKKAAAKKKK